MQLDDRDNFKSPLYLSIIYVPFDKAKVPSVKEAEELFAKMLNDLRKCMKK